MVACWKLPLIGALASVCVLAAPAKKCEELASASFAKEFGADVKIESAKTGRGRGQSP